jgi:hypothetical protein
VALVGAGRADATGRLASARAVRVRGMPPGIETVADGGHVLTVVEDGRDVACGAIPGMS